MNKITIYGIPNCDTVKKTTDWFRKNKVEFDFHDYKKEGISKSKLQAWCRQAGWEKLLNKKSTTWRNTDAAIQAGVTNTSSAIALMLEQTSLIKRPVIETAQGIVIGFDEKNISSLINQKK